MTILNKVCAACGGWNVGRDAAVRWDAEKQDWTVATVYDDAWCEDCGSSEATLEDVERPAPDSPENKPPSPAQSSEAMAEALRAVRDWHDRAPIEELETVEAAIQENFPIAMVEEALSGAHTNPAPQPLDAAREAIVRSSGAIALLAEFMEWEREAWESDGEINGGDAVEFMGDFRKRVKALLGADNSPKTEAVIMDEVCADLDRIAQKVDTLGSKSEHIAVLREFLGDTIGAAHEALCRADETEG